ncbi:MAG: YwiC-like family protein [Anaerolineales bacterium]|nr:YwiC-like family protein [Anaerolineales bacterium]
MQNTLFKKHIAVPQDHGSWVFILSPLLVGIFAGKNFNYATFNLIVACMAAFMLRQPATTLIKILARRRPKEELPVARFWIALYSGIALLSVIALILEGFKDILYLAVPGALVFGWHLWLVSKRKERKQAGVEIIATGILSLAAPAAYWIGIGHYAPTGWWLWILVWIQSAASIVYAYLRLEQRVLDSFPTRREQWKMGFRAALYTTFNLASTLTLGLVAALPALLFLPYLLQWAETMWGILHPAVGWKPTRIGVRQLIVSALWTILFIATWK